MEHAGTTVLVIEDDLDLRELLRALLTRNGYQVTLAASGREGLRVFHETHPEMVVLDIGLPDLAGWEVLERIRDMSDAPVLVLTARSEETDKVRGLSGGADDYMTKPFGHSELVARLYALSRRLLKSSEAPPVFDDGRLRVDMATQEVVVAGHTVTLTPTEYRLLVALIHQAGQVVASEQLLEQAWDEPDGNNADRIKYAVLRLRRKMGWGDPDTSPLESVRGFGYRYRIHV